MNKYFLAGFALLLLGLYGGLRAGSWITPEKTKIKVVKVKAKKLPPQIKVVKVEVPVPVPVRSVATCEPPKKVKRSVASIPKTSPVEAKAVEKAKEEPVVVAAPAASTPAPTSESIIPQTLPVQSPAAQSLLAPTIKSIQTED